jgi:hypothetical protein
VNKENKEKLGSKKTKKMYLVLSNQTLVINKVLTLNKNSSKKSSKIQKSLDLTSTKKKPLNLSQL